MQFTPDNITELNLNEVFVYGANEAGIHGAGAARLAVKWGARYGKYGFSGATYGIPTKDAMIQTLPLDKIQRHINVFLKFARLNKQLTFLVTPIGCGLAGYRPQDIAPFFRKALDMPNVVLPKCFVDILVMR